MSRLTIETEFWTCKLSLASLSALPGQAASPSRLFRGEPVCAVRVVDLLASLSTDPAHFVTFASEDGCSVCVRVNELGDAVLAYRIGEQALPAALGGPIRLVLGDDCCRGLKRVCRLRVTLTATLDVLPRCGHSHAA